MRTLTNSERRKYDKWRHEHGYLYKWEEVGLTHEQSMRWYSGPAWHTYYGLMSSDSPPDSWVYFLEVVHKPFRPVKIGTTRGRPDIRAASVQNGCWEQLIIRQLLPGDYRLESELHQRFAKARVFNEWFGNGQAPWILKYADDLAADCLGEPRRTYDLVEDNDDTLDTPFLGIEGFGYSDPLRDDERVSPLIAAMVTGETHAPEGFEWSAEDERLVLTALEYYK